MELWIRSQDKSMLIKVDNIVISDEEPIIYTHQSIDTNQIKYSLGTYKTRERALEVLDEIQKLLKPQMKVKNEFKKSELTGNCNWEQDVEYINISTKVYEMPQE